MKKILNPWIGVEGYNCFGCSPDNPVGVKMEFFEDGDDVVSFWKPQPQFQGWLKTLHGGIQSVLLDEICGWVVVCKMQTCGMTAKMETRYQHSISTDDSQLTLRAHLVEIKRNIAIIEATIADSTGQICTRAVCSYFTYPQEWAIKEFHFNPCKLEDKE